MLQGRMIKRNKSENCDGVMLKNAADMYEALIGALFMDNGDLSQSIKFLCKTCYFDENGTMNLQNFVQHLDKKTAMNSEAILLGKHHLTE